MELVKDQGKRLGGWTKELKDRETHSGWPCHKTCYVVNIMQDTQLYKALAIVRRLAGEKRPLGEEKSRRWPKKEGRNVTAYEPLLF